MNREDLDNILRAEVFVNEDNGQLRASHVILGVTTISRAYQAPECIIKARNPRLHCISVNVEGFLLPIGAPIPEGTLLAQPVTDGTFASQHIPEGVPNVTSSLQHTLGEATSSHPSSQKGDEEEDRPREVVDVSNLEDLYEVFNQLPSLVTEEETTLSDLMGIQRKPKSNFLELLESPPGGKPSWKSIPPQLPPPPSQPHLPTPPPVQQTHAEPTDHKRKRDDKGKKAMDARKSHSHQGDDPQRGSKHPRGMQTRSAQEADKRGELPVTTLAWAPPMELNGVPLTKEASIRDF